MNSVNTMNNQLLAGSLRDVVHIIPLGHEIDRAVAPFTKNKADRAYILAIPPDAGLDPGMVKNSTTLSAG